MHARVVSIILVRKFSVDSTPNLITKSSPMPTVKANDSVYLAASRLIRPAGVAYPNTRKSGYLGRRIAPNNIATPAPIIK